MQGSKFQEYMRIIMNKIDHLVTDKDHPCFGMAAAAFKHFKRSYEAYAGYENNSTRKFLDENSIFRVASISKLVTVLGVIAIVKERKLDIDQDISKYFDQLIRNPDYPESSISIRMLLSHTSSIRDGNNYNFSYDTDITSVLKLKEHWANENEQEEYASLKPGQYFFYSNLNYGMVATILERVTGQRFDSLMAEKVFYRFKSPMTFNPATFSASNKDHIAELYRRDEKNQWICEFGKKDLEKEFEKYTVGTNGSLFAPHGGLFTTLNGLMEIVDYLFSQKSDDVFNDFLEPVWSYNQEAKNGDNYGGLMKCYGSGIQILTGSETDSLLENVGKGFIGHSADAYGLIGGVYLDLTRGNAIIYIITGTDKHMKNHLGEYSSFYKYEEMIFESLSDYFV